MLEILRNTNGETPSPAEQSFSTALSFVDEKIWPFHCGDPELWKFKDQLVVPNGRVLDIGMGAARVSLPFALWGMEIDGYEQNPEYIQWLTNLKTAFGLNLPLNLKQEDVLQAQFESDAYDIVFLSHTFTHFDNKEDVYRVLDKGFNALKPGGNIWVRALGKEDDFFKNPIQPYDQRRRLNEDVIEAPCGCSGEMRHDPFLFLDQTELLSYFSARGGKIIHSQVLPEFGQTNIMYGRDDLLQHQNNRYKDNGIVSVLAQRR